MHFPSERSLTIWPWLVAIVLLNLGDLLTTALFLSRGIPEGNVLFRSLLAQGWTVAIVTKLLGALLTVTCFTIGWWLARPMGPRYQRLVWWLLVLLAALYAATVAYNLVAISR